MNSWHNRRLRPKRLISGVLVAGMLATGLAACSSASSGTGSTTSAGGPELTNITVGVLASADAVTLQIAQDKGFFKQQGLNVKTVIMTTTNQASQGLLSGTMQFGWENYVGMFSQENTVPGLKLKIVADNAQATPNIDVLMVAKNSPITSLAQLKGKKVSFPALGFNYGAMATDVLGQPYSLTTSDFTTVVVPFPDAGQALAKGEVQAAFTIEPFITILEKQGDRVLEDLLSGPLTGFPLDCWATTAGFASKDPKTVAAFQRAIGQATSLAASDPALVRQELPKFIPTLTPQLASVIQLPTFNPTLSLSRMERVADVMEQLHHLPANFNTTVESMYDPLPSSSGS